MGTDTKAGSRVRIISQHNKERAERLLTLRTQVRDADLNDDERFRTMICDARELLELPERQMADGLFVSRPTLNRWINGRNLPYASARRHAAKWIDDQLSAKLRRRASADLPAVKTGESPTISSNRRILVNT